MSELLSRRAVLLGGSALAFMAACGKKGNNTIKVGHTSTTQGQKNVLSTQVASTMLVSGIEERVAFGLLQGVPAAPVAANSQVHVSFQRPGETAFSEPVLAEYHPDGLTLAIYVARHTFDVPGNWTMRATMDGKRPGDAAIAINDPAKVEWPVPGKPLFAVATPTTDNPMGVNPICTRADSACPFHTTSLDAVLGKNGKPTVVLLATPALCQSAMCGPVLEILMSDSEAVRDKLNIVHVEVYSDTTGKTLSPAFAAFHTDSEPVLYLADKHGVLTERFNGPFDKTEAADALQRLLA